MLNEEHVGSIYALQNPDHPVTDPLASTVEADVAVVGGGLAGLTTALILCKGGVSVALVEANRVGWGASGRNGGFVSAGFAQGIFELEDKVGLSDAQALYSLSREGMEFVRNRAKNIDELVGGSGWLKVIRHDAPDLLKRQAERWARDYAVELQFWNRDQLREALVTDRYFSALFDPQPFHIDPLAYARALALAARRGGVRIYERSRVTRLERRLSWQLSTTGAGGASGRITADDVVLATSAYGSDLWPGVDRAILPVATYVAAFEPIELPWDAAIRFGGCIADTRRAGDYYRLIGQGSGRRLVWGGRITTRRREPADLAGLLLADIGAVYPQLSRPGSTALRPVSAWSGLMGYTASKMPIVGKIGPGLWACTGFGGQGLNTTAMAAMLVGQAIVTGDDRWERFAAFHPGAFGRFIGGSGLVGRLATQAGYLAMKLRDRFDEARSRG